jgi:hypothetical protein
LDDQRWSKFIAAIALHPSLFAPSPFMAFDDDIFDDIDDDTDPDEDGLPSPSVKCDRTEAVADVLLVNKQVDEIQIPVHTFHV